MLTLLIASLPALAQEPQPPEPSDTEKTDWIDDLFDYAGLHKYGATLGSIGLQMDTSRLTQFQIVGPTVQTPVLLRFESAQYTTGVGGSFLRAGIGFLHEFPPSQDFYYDPDEEFGLGMHYVYDLSLIHI